MEIKSDDIKNVLDSLIGSIDEKNIELYRKITEEAGFDIDDYETFYLRLIYPYNNFLHGLISENIVKNDKMFFFLTHSDFVENQFKKLIIEKEGSGCSSDKSRTIMRGIYNFILTGKRIDFNYEGEYTFHLPKSIFKTHEDIMMFYEGVYFLYYGNYKKYLESLKIILKNNE